MIVLCVQAALGADVTHMAPAMRDGTYGVELNVTYDGFSTSGRLVEGNEVISERRVIEHSSDAWLELSPIPGIALLIGGQRVHDWRWSYPDARKMLLEPVDGGGSYLESPNTDEDAPELRGRGFTGVWIGAAFQPFSESFKRPQRVTWRIDLAYRTGSRNQNRWVIGDNGIRGGGPGSSAIRGTLAFSHAGTHAEPYVRARIHHETKVTVQLADAAGDVRVDAFDVDPASTVSLIGGTEVKIDEGQTRLDVRVGARYRSWEDLPGGLLLPNTLDSVRSIPSTHSESVAGLAGLGLLLELGDSLRARVGGDFVYEIPHRQEHLFAVSTSTDTFTIQWNVGLTSFIGVRPKKGPTDPPL